MAGSSNPGSFRAEPGPPALTADAMPVRVYRYLPHADDPVEEPEPEPDPEGDGEDGGGEPEPKKKDAVYTAMPNVYYETSFERQGAEPTTAQFAYLLDDVAAIYRGWPRDFEQVWPLQSRPGRYKFEPGDRIVAYAVPPGRSSAKELLFDGYVSALSADVSGDVQGVSFAAVSAEVRCWDRPIAGSWRRDADRPASTSEEHVVLTNVPARFNADGRPNCTDDAHPVDATADAGAHPVFCDAGVAYWTLAGAAKYILARHNVKTETVYRGADHEDLIVDGPDFGALEALLDGRRPKEGSESYDPDDPSTYDESPITLSDYDASNRPWPEALAELLGYYGFGMRFRAEFDEKDRPWHHLEIYRNDAAGPREPKDLLLPKGGETVDAGAVNVGSLRIAADFRDVANEIEVETANKLYEASFVLAPGFHVDADDALAENAGRFLRSAEPTADNEQGRRYRRYVFDETLDGHWSFADGAWVDVGTAGAEPPSLDEIMPDEGHGIGGGPPTRQYVRRPRPGRNTLLADPGDDDPPRAMLHLSRDYAGPDPPCVWDGTGTWQPIAGSWRLLDDRLGVFVTADDVRAWKIGDNRGVGQQEDSTKLDALRSIAAPDPDVKSASRFFLRLTTVIEGDQGVEVRADRRAVSPQPFTVTRRVDGRDHYGAEERSKSSPLGDPAVVRTGEWRAHAKAAQLRASREFPPYAGAVTIPHLDFSIQVGDRIGRINGRDVSLRTNAGAEAGEAESYPVVVARTFSVAGDRQTTTLQLSDRRAESADGFLP